MILKPQEDSRRDVEILERLREHPSADNWTRRKIDEQIRNIISGDRGEADAAYELKVHFGTSRNWAVINDLRIEHDGLVAQIDHLLINRLLEVWVLESKRFANGITINDQGEFATWYDRKQVGMPSPIEQNKRHLLVLKKVVDSGLVKLPTRLGFTLRPQWRSLVLISRGAIRRPKVSFPGLETVIKHDQVSTTVQKMLETGNPLDIAKVISPDSLMALAQQFVDLHRPIAFDWVTRFGIDEGKPVEAAKVLPPPPPPPKPVIASKKLASDTTKPTKAAQESAPSCAACTAPLTRGVAQFCRNNTEKFAGQLYCMPCQPKITANPAQASPRNS